MNMFTKFRVKMLIINKILWKEKKKNNNNKLIDKQNIRFLGSKIWNYND